MAKQPTKQQAAPGKRKPSRTAQALDRVLNEDMSVRDAANIYNITPQSIYRLIAYRIKNPVCPVCGR